MLSRPEWPTPFVDGHPRATQHPDFGWHRDRKDDAAQRARRAHSAGDRIVVIEDTAEIHLDKPNVLRLEARRAQLRSGRRRPSRRSRSPTSCAPRCVIARIAFCVGEVRGAEAFDLLQALNTGHLGSLSTIHANSAEQAFTRLAHCVLTANVGLPHHSIREAIALAIHVIVHISRIDGLRRVTESLMCAG